MLIQPVIKDYHFISIHIILLLTVFISDAAKLRIKTKPSHHYYYFFFLKYESEKTSLLLASNSILTVYCLVPWAVAWGPL